MQIGLKLGSKNTQYTDDIFTLFNEGFFQYIELFVIPESYNSTIEYWKQFSIPFVIHAPHSGTGLNPSIKENRNKNKILINEVFNFSNSLNSEFIIFHPGLDGDINETVFQLLPNIDSRCLIENKPFKGLDNENCIGSSYKEIQYLITELKSGFCLDFGHAICASNTLNIEPINLINDLISLKPSIYHLTDGNFNSEYDVHLHYGKGDFPLRDLINLIPQNSKITNEAKHDFDNNLNDFKIDCNILKSYFKDLSL